MSKFSCFTNDELYMLKRCLIESSGIIALSGLYSNEELILSGKLLDEVINEIVKRKQNSQPNNDEL